MELRQLADNVYFIPNVTNIGVIREKDDVILIDSGLDDDAAKKIIKCVANEGLGIKALINTHSHADHIGGNHYIQDKTGAEIYAPEVEASVIEYPLFEPFYLFSGAEPISELKTKHLMSKPSIVNHILKLGQKSLVVGETEFRIFELPGHSLNQIGLEVQGVFFCGDSCFAEEVIEKHRLPFCINVAAQKKTLDLLKKNSEFMFVPGHGAATDRIGAAADRYLMVLARAEDISLEILEKPMNISGFLGELCSAFELNIREARQYYLMNTIAMAILGSLHTDGRIAAQIEANEMLWSRI